MESVGLLFDVLALAGFCAFCDGFGEDGEEFADVGAGEAGEGGEIAFGAEFDGGFGFVFENLRLLGGREGWWWRGEGGMLTPM